MNTKRFFHPDQLSAIRAGCDWRRLLDDLGVRADVKRYSPFIPTTGVDTHAFTLKSSVRIGGQIAGET